MNIDCMRKLIGKSKLCVYVILYKCYSHMYMYNQGDNPRDSLDVRESQNTYFLSNISYFFFIIVDYNNNRANTLVLIHHWKMDAMAHLVLIRYNYSCSYTKGKKKKGRKYTTRLSFWNFDESIARKTCIAETCLPSGSRRPY